MRPGPVVNDVFAIITFTRRPAGPELIVLPEAEAYVAQLKAFSRSKTVADSLRVRQLAVTVAYEVYAQSFGRNCMRLQPSRPLAPAQ